MRHPVEGELQAAAGAAVASGQIPADAAGGAAWLTARSWSLSDVLRTAKFGQRRVRLMWWDGDIGGCLLL